MLWDDLSEEQKAAAQAPGGLTRVTAGAGTGKTTFLTFRIDWLIRQAKIQPQRILAMSFTKAASREIAERAARLGSGSPVNSCTMHSLAARLLREYYENAGLPERFAILDEDDEAPTLNQVARAWAESTDSEWTEDANDNVGDIIDPKNIKWVGKLGIAKIITRWRENMISPAEAVERYSRPGIESRYRIAAELYDRLSVAMKTSEAISMAELIGRATFMLENDELLRDHVSGKYHHILIDEFQDVNMAQIRFLNVLASAWKNLTIVGDDDQSLYLFRHAIPEAMRRAPQLLAPIAEKGLNDYTLTINRRSPDSILSCANTLVEHNPRSGPKRLSSGKEGHDPAFREFMNDRHEAAFIAQSIEGMLSDGVPGREIAVLSRGKMPLGAIAKSLLLRGIPHVVTTGAGFLERKVIRDVMAWVRLAINPNCSSMFARAAGSPPRGLGEKAIHTITNAAITHGGGSIIEGLRYCLDENILPKKAAEGAEIMLNTLDELNAQTLEPTTDIAEFLKQICIDTGYRDWAIAGAEDDRKADQIKQDLADLIEIGKEMQSMERVSTIIEFSDELSLAEDRNSHAGPDAIHLGTVHGAKGLEWDHVFVAGMESGSLPAIQNIEEMGPASSIHDPWDMTTGCLEEERRICHVAATRARQTLIMTMAKNRPNKYNMKRSQFIYEMWTMPKKTKYINNEPLIPTHYSNGPSPQVPEASHHQRTVISGRFGRRPIKRSEDDMDMSV